MLSVSISLSSGVLDYKGNFCVQFHELSLLHFLLSFLVFVMLPSCLVASVIWPTFTCSVWWIQFSLSVVKKKIMKNNSSSKVPSSWLFIIDTLQSLWKYTVYHKSVTLGYHFLLSSEDNESESDSLVKQRTATQNCVFLYFVICWKSRQEVDKT